MAIVVGCGYPKKETRELIKKLCKGNISTKVDMYPSDDEKQYVVHVEKFVELSAERHAFDTEIEARNFFSEVLKGA